MIRTFFPRMAILMQIGIAFGFFIGCSVINSLKKSESDSGPNPTTAELEQRLSEIETEISENPANAEIYYQKGRVLNKLAHLQPAPQDRTEYYRQMRQSLMKSGSLFQSSTNREGVDKVDEIQKVSWSFEHNQGVEILRTDSTLKSGDFNRAAAHFNNAITIIPDSVVSYKMKAQAHYRNHQVGSAIETLETADNRITSLPSDLLEQLAFLYLEENRHQQAIELYERAELFSDKNLNLIHGLANAYITAGEHAEAVELLQALVESEPENVIYRESYGTELYNLGLQKFDSLLAESNGNPAVTEQYYEQANTLMNRSAEQLKKARELNPESIGLKKQLAFVYQNIATQLRQVKPQFDESTQREIDKNIEANLNHAVSLFEQLVNQGPEPEQTRRYWKQLYQAYSYLGMQQKATEAKAKANL